MPTTMSIGIYVYNEFEPLDVWGFVQAFAITRFLGQEYADPGPYPFHISFIANTMDPVTSYNGPRVAPDMTREEAAARTFDVFMIPGGRGTAAVLEDATAMRWVRAMDAKATIMASVCTGAAVLATAGLLDGRAAATNHNAFSWVASLRPQVHWDRIARWVDTGKYVTSAGVSSGTDMAFYLVSRLMGQAVADIAAAEAEYHWQRDPRAQIPY